MTLKLPRSPARPWPWLPWGLALAFTLTPLHAQDAPEGAEGEPPPEDSGSGNPVVETLGEGAPEPEDQDFRPDLIELRVAFDDRLGKAAAQPYALIRPDNDPQTIRCDLKDDGSDVQDIKGDLVYTCTVRSQRTQSIVIGVFHSPGGEDVEVITRKIKLPSSPSATIAFRAPKDYAKGTFKIMDPFFFMEPDPEGDPGGVPRAGSEGEAIVSVLDEGKSLLGIPAAEEKGAAAEAPGSGARAPDPGRQIIPEGDEPNPEDEGKNPAVEPVSLKGSGESGYVLPVKKGAPSTGSVAATSASGAAGGGEVGAFQIPARAVDLRPVWAALALLFLIQFLRMGLLDGVASALGGLRARLESQGKGGIAARIPDLQPLARRVRGIVGGGPATAPLASPPVASSAPGAVGDTGAALAQPPVGATVYVAAPRPSGLNQMLGALAQRIAGSPAGPAPGGLGALLPEGASLFSAAGHLRALHAAGALELHLWDGIPLKAGSATAILAPDALRIPLLTALARETAGRHGLPTLLLTTRADGFQIEIPLLTTRLKGRAYPSQWALAEVPPAAPGEGGDERPPSVGDRLAIAPGPHGDLSALQPFIQGALGQVGAAVILVDRLSAHGLTDDLVAPERMIAEMLEALAPLRALGSVYAILVGAPKDAPALKAAAEGEMLALLEIGAGPPGDLLEAKELGEGEGRRVHLEVNEGAGWMWPVWQSDPIRPVWDLTGLVIDRRRGEDG